jgi:hypothetical protein
VVSFGRDTKGKRRVIVTPDLVEAREYQVADGKAILVKTGEMVRPGDMVADGISSDIVGEVSVGTFEGSTAKFEIVRSSAIVAPREDPILTHPIAP